MIWGWPTNAAYPYLFSLATGWWGISFSFDRTAQPPWELGSTPFTHEQPVSPLPSTHGHCPTGSPSKTWQASLLLILEMFPPLPQKPFCGILRSSSSPCFHLYPPGALSLPSPCSPLTSSRPPGFLILLSLGFASRTHTTPTKDLPPIVLSPSGLVSVPFLSSSWIGRSEHSSPLC